MDNVVIFNITYKTELLFSNFFFMYIYSCAIVFLYISKRYYTYVRSITRVTQMHIAENTFSRPWNNIDHTAGEISKRFKLIKRQHCVNTQRFFQSIYITEVFHFSFFKNFKKNFLYTLLVDIQASRNPMDIGRIETFLFIYGERVFNAQNRRVSLNSFNLTPSGSGISPVRFSWTKHRTSVVNVARSDNGGSV